MNSISENKKYSDAINEGKNEECFNCLKYSDTHAWLAYRSVT